MARTSRTGKTGENGQPNPLLDNSEFEGSRIGAIYQRLRNPSTKTGIFLVLAAILIVTAPFIPTWVRNTQEGLASRRDAQERFESSLISQELLVPSQVVPYLNRRVVQMANADTPEAWRVISFESGACSEPHFAQLPDGKYTQALREACGEIHAVQVEYASSCADEASCNVPLEARTRLLDTMEQLYVDFADSGLVLPYTYEEQIVGPE